MFPLVLMLTVWLACGFVSALWCGIAHYRNAKLVKVDDLGLLGIVVLAGPIVLVCLPCWWYEKNKSKVLIDHRKDVQ